MSGAGPPEGFTSSDVEPAGTRLVLVRHGEAWCNARGVVGGPRGCGGLTDLGRAQTGALAARLALSRELEDASAVYSSVLPRARETAQILLGSLAPGLEAVADCDLCELHPGEADALTWDEVVSRFGAAPDWDRDPSAPVAPGGESWTGFYERCRGAFERLVAAHEGERVVLVVHGGVIEQAMKVALGAAPEARLHLLTRNCSMTEIEFDGARRRLLRYNDRAPLPAK